MSIETVDLVHVFMPGTPAAVTAVDGVSLRLEDGEAVGIMGPTGSGKSTLIQHFNGLLRPTSGRVLIDGEDLWGGASEAGAAGGARRTRGLDRTAERGRTAGAAERGRPADRRAGPAGPGPRGRKVDLRAVRQKVGLIFQFPEYQLFEETVFDDIAFGPRNLGLDEAEVKRRVREALAIVGLGPDQEGPPGIERRSPFSLSSGQMRRVAIAGVLAMKPKTLVLDEPTAGLDPRGRQSLLDSLLRLHHELGLTLVIVSHNMEDLARLVDRVIVLDRGRIVEEGPTRQVFSRVERLQALGLDAPPVVSLMQKLARRGAKVRTDVLDAAEAADEIDRWLKVGAGGGRDRVDLR